VRVTVTSTAARVKCACTSPALAMPEGLGCWVTMGEKSDVIPSTRSVPARLCGGTANGFGAKTYVLHVFFGE